MSLEPLDTAHGSDFPVCRQLSVFLENRLGQLLRLTRLFEPGDIDMLGLSVDAAVDCAIVRFMVDDPDGARERLSEHRFPISENEVLVVEMPPGKKGLMSICAALIAGEVNINYVYPLLPGESRGPCLVVQVDNLAAGAAALAMRNYRVLDQSEL